MATVSASYKKESWLTYKITIDYTASNGALTINSVTGSHNYSSGDTRDCTQNLNHTIGFPGGSGTLTTYSGADSSGHGTGFKANNGTWVWDIGGAKTYYGGGTGDLTLTIAADGIAYWPSNITFNFGNINIGYSVTTPTLSDVTVHSEGRNTASAYFSVTNNGGAAIVSQRIECSPTYGGTSVSTIWSNSGQFSGLSPNTTYYAKGYASNGTYEGGSMIKAFSTIGNAPTINSVNAVPTKTTCNLQINVTYDTNDAYSSQLIEYGTTSSYGSSTTSNDLYNLTPNTTYYYKVTITSILGRSGTYTGSFTTDDYDYIVKLKVGETYKDAFPYIKVDNEWKKAVPEIKIEDEWKKGI